MRSLLIAGAVVQLSRSHTKGVMQGRHSDSTDTSPEESSRCLRICLAHAQLGRQLLHEEQPSLGSLRHCVIHPL